MNIEIEMVDLKAFVAETRCKSKLLATKLEHHWNNDRRVSFDIESLSTADVSALNSWLVSKSKGNKKLAHIARKVATYVNLKANPVGKEVISLEPLVTALKAYLKPSPHKWLFAECEDGSLLPYYVNEIVYEPRDESSPAQTSMALRAIERGGETGKKLYWRAAELSGKDVKKRNVIELLQDKGYFLETPEAVARYEAEIVAYKTVNVQTGEQFLAAGKGHSVVDSWWGNGLVAMERDGRKTKVVIDDGDDDDDNDDDDDAGTRRSRRKRRSNSGGIVDGTFWSKRVTDVDADDDDAIADEDKDSSVALPVHPYVQVFDLTKHRYLTIHINNLEPYQYDGAVFDKLVLPDDVKDLVRILVEGSTEQLDDIVAGKTGGTIVIATGSPGTGKTLTAEVFSETIKRPLYVVQCSQLGTDEEALEKHLTEVLARATRWKAILLIDEADVYVHERGADIQQNAIVGVFLRVLEYYQGVLFMTSNRSVVIDDAIMSRATAWIKYDVPSVKDQLAIWSILSEQFGVKLDQATLTKLRNDPTFHEISGRNVKNLLKLAIRMATAKNLPVNFDLLVNVSRYLDLRGERKTAEGG